MTGRSSSSVRSFASISAPQSRRSTGGVAVRSANRRCRSDRRQAFSSAPCNLPTDQNKPVIRPSSVTSMLFAAGTLGRPGMVMISPQIATTNSAPAESLTSRTLMT
jgi:hypothetical protein